MARSVLLVEDDCLEVLLFREALRACGVSGPIAVANGGGAALAYLSERCPDDPPAFILIDLETPDGGFDLLRCLRVLRDFKDIPAVVISPKEDEEALANAAQLGADAFLVRPPGVETLKQALSALAQRWLS
jgi:CheY-like chemotaxis protein